MTMSSVGLVRLNLGMEIASREGKTFVLVITTDLPRPFFQIISLRNQPIEERIAQYLGNARLARKIDDTQTLAGEALLLGFCESDIFEDLKETGRIYIGAESQQNLKLKVRRKFPEETPRVGFSHSTARGLEISSMPQILELEEIVHIASALQNLKRLRFE
jgi:hypothetical protein